MWIIEGAFDGEPGNLEKQKLKLLKPGRAYPLGRKAKHPLQLVLSHPKVSGEHVTFAVGEHSVDQIDDPDMKPELRILNHKSRIMQVSRGNKERIFVQPLAEEVLLSGDVIALVTGIYVSVWWRPVCCYVPPKTPSIAFDKCASLGIKIVSTPQPEVTHHLTQLLDTTPAIATSLLNPTHLVRPDWLTELLHLGETAASADSPSVLETDFRLPAEKQHRPPFSPSLPAPLKSYTLWEVSDARMGLLKGWRLVFIGGKGRELDIETRTLVERGQGEYEAFDVDGGATRLRQAITRNKRKSGTEAWKGVSVIGNPETLKVAAGDLWDAMQDMLKSFGLRIIDHVQLIQAVLYSDTTRIDSSLNVNPEQESSLPEEVPNTHLDESSLPSRSSEAVISSQDPESAPRARLPRRVASRTTTPATGLESTSVQPAPVEQDSVPLSDPAPSRMSEEPETAKRKRPLVRRTRANAVPPPILGIDDPSSIISQSPELDSAITPVAPSADAPTSEVPSFSSTTQPMRPSRLKRRAGTAAPLDPILAELEQEIAEAMTQQPPLKRFKALFDETDPDRIASEALGSAFSGGIIDSQMFSQLPTESGGAGLSGPPLAAVPEEVEESQPVQASRVNEAEDMQMEDEDTSGPLSPRKNHPKPISTAVASSSQSQMPPAPFSSTQASKRASSKAGAAPGKPDTDAAFLKALASTKKGKRREDDFDREFNNLRISKPEQGNVEAEDWRVLADFGDESNLMGNFMVIVEMDVPANKSRSRTQSREPEKVDWQGKPDFKKFKKKTLARQRPAVELTVEDENDYGMGVAYWKGGSQSQSQSQPISQNEPTTTQHHSYLQPSQTQNRGFLQPDHGSEPSTLGTKPRSQSQPRTRGSQTKTKDSGRRGRSRGLQIVSEEEESGNEAQPAKKGKTGVHGKGKEKSQPLFLDPPDEGDGESGRHGLSDEIDLDLDLDGLSDDEPGEPTLRSTARSRTAAKPRSSETIAAPKRITTTKKRSAALLDDDSDTGVVFKGFGGRKKAKVK